MKLLKFLILFFLILVHFNCSWEDSIPTSSSNNSEPEYSFFDRSSPHNPKLFKLPQSAVKIRDNLFLIGKKGDLEGYAIIHKKRTNVKGGIKPDKPDKPSKDEGSNCYDFIARGAKWKTAEDYYINPVNNRNLDHQTLFDIFINSAEKWELAGNSENILGSGYLTYNILSADLTEPDNINEIYFAEIVNPGVIAVTIIWGRFGGPPQVRELVAWDQVYDEVDFSWSLNGESEKMDFENIATHELGHTVGLADLYDDQCNIQTMYGYAGLGEINKRSLEAGDIEGVFTLYN